MLRFDKLVAGQLQAGERVKLHHEGRTAGLNAVNSRPYYGAIATTDKAVIIAWTKSGLRASNHALRIPVGDLLGVKEEDKTLPGLAGAVARKNASHPLYRMLGKTSDLPSLALRTRHGDFTLFYGLKQRGIVRQMYVAIQDLIPASRG